MLCRLGLPGFDAAYSFGSYDGVMKELIHLFKYDRVETLARPLGRLMLSVLPRRERYDLVVPMPIHWRRRLARGFNQAERLARVVASACNVPVGSPVRRRRATAPQAGLTNAKRRNNVRGAFAMRRGASVRGMRILLVDDVLTTGATAAACARVLKRFGAKHVALATVARADRRSWAPEGRTQAAAAGGAP